CGLDFTLNTVHLIRDCRVGNVNLTQIHLEKEVDREGAREKDRERERERDREGGVKGGEKTCAERKLSVGHNTRARSLGRKWEPAGDETDRVNLLSVVHAGRIYNTTGQQHRQ